jgi:capsular exopolysaccharide synthesis family protein
MIKNERVVKLERSTSPTANAAAFGSHFQGPTASPPVPDSSLFDLRKLGEIIRRRAKLFLIVALAVFLVVVAIMMLLPRTYSATVLLQVDPNIQRRSDLGSSVVNTQPDSALVDSEIAIIQSREVAQAVVQRFDLVSDEEFLAKAKQSLPIDKKLDLVTDALQRHVSVSRDGLTYIVSISFSSSSPSKSAKIANAYALEYLAASRAFRGRIAEERSQALSKQLSGLSSEVEAADEKIANYQSSTGTVIGGGTSTGTVTDRLIDGIAAGLAQAESEAAQARAQAEAARRASPENASQVLTSDSIIALRAQQAELSQRRADALASVGPAHPMMIRLNEQLQSVNTAIAEEVRRTMSGLNASAAAAESRAANLRGQLARLRGEQGSNARAAVTADAMKARADATRVIYNNLNQASQEMKEQAQVTGAQANIISPASLPNHPSFPSVPLFLAFGFLLANASGLVTVMVVEGLRGGFRSSPEIEARTGEHVIGALLELSPRQLKAAEGSAKHAIDYVRHRPASGYVESLRGIRSGLLTGSARSGTLLTITSAMPAEGKTTTSIALARVMAASGDSVLLIDGDLRKAAVSTLLVPQAEFGLIEVLDGQASPDLVIFDDPLSPLKILPLRKKLFTEKDVFNDGKFVKLLNGLRQSFDWILIDAPPVLSVTDARHLAAIADRVVLIVRWETTPVKAVTLTLDKIRSGGAVIAGVILNRVSRKSIRSLADVDPEYYGYSEDYHQN